MTWTAAPSAAEIIDNCNRTIHEMAQQQIVRNETIRRQQAALDRMCPLERSLLRKTAAIEPGEALHLTHAEFRFLQSVVGVEERPAWPGVQPTPTVGRTPIVVDHPKGYPTKVTPRPRRRRRR